MKRIRNLFVVMLFFGITAPSLTFAINIDSTDIIDGEVKAADIAFNAVSTSRIVDGAVTDAKIGGTISATKIQQGSGSGLDADKLDGLDSTAFAPAIVGTSNIAVGAVTDAKISGTISATKIQQGSGSTLDADKLDGLDSTAFAPAVIGTANIADGAITNSKIPNNEITAAKISDGAGSGLNADMLDGVDSSEFAKKSGNVIVVSTSGGDYTTIQAAIDSVNPSESNPYLIRVMPGTYSSSVAILMKSNVYIQGAGAEVTTIESFSTSTQSHVISISGLENVVISGLTIKGAAVGINSYQSSNIIIKSNIFTGRTTNSGRALYLGTTSSVIEDNTFKDEVSPYIDGIWISEGNTKILRNKLLGLNKGIILYRSGGIVANNVITGGEPNAEGIYLQNYWGSVLHNQITNYSYYDIRQECDVYCDRLPNISFNIYDTMYGNYGVGLYNVKSDGTPAIEP